MNRVLSKKIALFFSTAIIAGALLLTVSRPALAAVGLNDFNGTTRSGLLTTDFNEGVVSGHEYTVGSTNGLSGSDFVATNNKTNIWTSQQTIQPDSDESYVVEGYFRNAVNSGFGGLGFTTNSTIAPDENDYPMPESGLGIVFHGGAGGFTNNTAWNAVNESSELSWAGGDLDTPAWYFIRLEVASTGPGVFDMQVDIYPSDSDGTLGVKKTSHIARSVANAAMGSSPAVHAYFGTTGVRFDRIDNFSFNAEPTSIPAYVPPISGGAGTELDPWLVSDCKELQAIDDDSALYDDYFKQDADIDCSESNINSENFDSDTWDSDGFRPIASSDQFYGQYDGDGYEISNLYMDRDGDNRVGLFAEITEGSLVIDTHLVDASITGNQAVGVLVGVSFGTVEDASASGEVYGSAEAGGLVGGNEGWDTIINSHASVDVTAEYSVGGLSGSNFGNIYDSSASGTVYGLEYVGGLVGYSSDGEDGVVTIENSSATGAVTGTLEVGGLVGYADKTDIVNGFATGTVQGEAYEIDPSYIGGLAGRLDTATLVEQSYYQGTVNSGDRMGGLVGGAAGATIVASFSDADINGANDYVGGLVGYADSIDVVDSYATTTIEGDVHVGGAVGTATNSDFSNIYAVGSIASTASQIGGLIGDFEDSSLSDAFAAVAIASSWPTTVSGGIGTTSNSTATNLYVDGSLSTQDCSTIGGIGDVSTIDRTVVNNEGAQPSYFLGNSTNAPLDVWDFNATWVVNDSYPCLQWYSECDSLYQPPYPDLNGDGIDDVDQPNIGGYRNGYTGKIIAMDMGENCELTTDDMTEESNFAVIDAMYEYDNGLFEFAAECSVETTTIKLYYYDVDPSGLVARKFSTRTNTYFNLDDAVITTQTINGHSVTVVTYQLTDNSERDMDLEVGMIEDPAGLARSVVGVPNTGLLKQL